MVFGFYCMLLVVLFFFVEGMCNFICGMFYVIFVVLFCKFFLLLLINGFLLLLLCFVFFWLFGI